MQKSLVKYVMESTWTKKLAALKEFKLSSVENIFKNYTLWLDSGGKMFGLRYFIFPFSVNYVI